MGAPAKVLLAILVFAVVMLIGSAVIAIIGLIGGTGGWASQE